MGLYRLDLQKTANNQSFWTNSYVVQTGSLTEAAALIDTYANRESGIHHAGIVIDKGRVSDMVPGTDQFIVKPLNVNGARTGGTSFLPLWDCVRVDFGVAIGRPSRKYLRIYLTEEDVDNSVLAAGLVSTIHTLYVNPMVGDDTYVDVDGQAIVAGTVYPNVQMRQLRRGSKRKARPVI